MQIYQGKRETDRRTTLHKIASFSPKCAPNVRTLSARKGLLVRAISLSKSQRSVERWMICLHRATDSKVKASFTLLSCFLTALTQRLTSRGQADPRSEKLRETEREETKRERERDWHRERDRQRGNLRERERERERDRDRDRDRQTDRDRERQRQRQTDRQTDRDKIILYYTRIKI